MNKNRKTGALLAVAGAVWMIVLFATIGERKEFSYQTGRMLLPLLTIVAGLYLLIKGASR